MAEDQAQAAGSNAVADHGALSASPQKKKPSWFRTILWMFSMMLLVNVVMGIIAYFLFFAHK